MVKNNRKGSARNSKLKKNLQNKIKLSRFDIIHVWNSETFKNGPRWNVSVGKLNFFDFNLEFYDKKLKVVFNFFTLLWKIYSFSF